MIQLMREKKLSLPMQKQYVEKHGEIDKPAFKHIIINAR